jgi:P-type Cu+ transporter
VARALVADGGAPLEFGENFRAFPGRGAEATVAGHHVYVGRGQAGSVTVEIDGVPAGAFEIVDSIRPESSEAVRQLRKADLDVWMLTGDHRRAALAIAREAGIPESRILAEVLPEAKEREVRRLKSEGHHVAMVGDGINDAPALASADVGIAIGAGTDVAVETGGIILMRSDLRGVPEALSLARRALRIIRQNLFWAFAYNVIGIPIAAGALYPFTGWTLSPMIASAAMALSSVSVVTNSLRLRRG